ncbi:exosortase N [[Flexibacter] sp. ATCC 35208]|uniref:exosortase N n=1 Tax=[Flexibacter] sp. ATCC 35208 TaxID=1936242 RepID=UPI0009D53545|nr:exosortase N [[Flexibacter] sp. ATCC 35208]OMP78940.1 exosortase N [[Flexibacter] sp. ATCC 35208]
MRILILVYLVLFLVGLQHFVDWQSAGFLLGLAALPFTTEFDQTKKGSQRYFYISIGLFALFLLVPVHTFYYLALITAVVFCLEMYVGRINLLPMLVMICMSPVFRFWADLFTFPIRLQLTALAGSVVMGAKVEGNIISCGGQDFSVDPACMGLQMTVTAMLCGMIIIGGFQKKYRKYLSVGMTLGVLSVAFGLNVIGNLIRIICLVQFKIMPDTPSHEAVGVMSLVGYVIVPFVFFSRYMIMRFGTPVVVEKKIYRIVPTGPLLLRNGILLPCMIYGCYVNLRPRPVVAHALPVKTAGYIVKNLPDDVTQLMSKDALVYVKFIPSYYYSEHHPMICWKGSGYTFEKVQEQVWDGRSVYTALLVEGNTKLYTAWWYDNGKHRTNSQLTWRWDVFTGARPYSLINVTASDEATLRKVIKTFAPASGVGGEGYACFISAVDKKFAVERFCGSSER